MAEEKKSGLAKRVDAAEAEALGNTPAAPAPIAAPAAKPAPAPSASLYSRIFGKSNPDNKLPDDAMHKAGTREKL